ncbi:MAG TPA: NDP-sugar synthase [Solirubrobacteraceae bacterium]|nr:NDP-sugar synthase [Solirubrobacteraceae bacterium]
MILAAGRGTRLAALGLKVPKPLVDVGGQPLLSRQLGYLAGQGVQRVVVNAHHLASAIESFAAEYKSPPELRVVVEPELLGTAGGVRNALDEFDGAPIIVLYGDVLMDAPLAPLLALHRGLDAQATLAVYRSTDVLGKGTLAVNDEGYVTGFQEKASTAVQDGALINAGLYVLEPEVVSSLPAGTPLDFGHDVFPALIAAGGRLAAHVLQEPVIDVGTPEGLAQARELVEARACARAPAGGKDLRQRGPEARLDP